MHKTCAHAIVGLVVAMLLGRDASLAHSDVNARPFRGQFVYQTAERTSFLRIKDGVAEAGPIVSKKGNPRFVDETLGTPALDCSRGEYRCLKIGPRILAVPNGPLF